MRLLTHRKEIVPDTLWLGHLRNSGVLLQRKLVDIDLVNALFGDAVKMVWEKIKPLTLEREPFEYLYNEMNKREQMQ